MKKIIILVTFLCAYSNIFALLTQANWRWRNDDGSETTATWKANQNVQAVQTVVGEVWRLRLEVYNNSGSSQPFVDTLQYATSASGPWTSVDVTAGSNAFQIAAASAYVAQDDPTTAQLAGVAYPFAAGKVMVGSSILQNISLNDQQRTEFEWAIQSTANATPNTVYYFRMWGTTAYLDSTSTYPSLITAGILPIKFTGFSAVRDDKRIRLQWGTSSEQNNGSFEIERSTDAKTWKPIASVSGNNSTAISSYTQYDASPLPGINYYVIKRTEADGQTYLSDIKSVKMPATLPMLSVYPNPAHFGVNFSVANVNASNVKATLTSINGSLVHEELFKTVSANAVNTLNMAHMPAPGIYVLNLEGVGLSQSIKVMVK